jgi:hypothetical protein
MRLKFLFSCWCIISTLYGTTLRRRSERGVHIPQTARIIHAQEVIVDLAPNQRIVMHPEKHTPSKRTRKIKINKWDYFFIIRYCLYFQIVGTPEQILSARMILSKNSISLLSICIKHSCFLYFCIVVL